MLVLSRRTKESLYIFPHDLLDPNVTIGELFKGSPIVITFKDLTYNRVKIGITAPKHLVVLRDDIVSESELVPPML